MLKFQKYALSLAESFDAWRVIPRIIVLMYSVLVTHLYLWYKSIPTFIQEKCDPSILRMLLESGIDINEAKLVACSIVDVVGGPTASQTTFVTTIIGLSTGIFGLYTATGRKWERGLPDNYDRRDRERNDHLMRENL